MEERQQARLFLFSGRTPKALRLMIDTRFIPVGDALAELEKKAAECEARAKEAQEPQATTLRELPELYRGWMKTLGSGLLEFMTSFDPSSRVSVSHSFLRGSSRPRAMRR